LVFSRIIIIIFINDNEINDINNSERVTSILASKIGNVAALKNLKNPKFIRKL